MVPFLAIFLVLSILSGHDQAVAASMAPPTVQDKIDKLHEGCSRLYLNEKAHLGAAVFPPTAANCRGLAVASWGPLPLSSHFSPLQWSWGVGLGFMAPYPWTEDVPRCGPTGCFGMVKMNKQVRFGCCGPRTAAEEDCGFASDALPRFVKKARSYAHVSGFSQEHVLDHCFDAVSREITQQEVVDVLNGKRNFRSVFSFQTKISKTIGAVSASSTPKKVSTDDEVASMDSSDSEVTTVDGSLAGDHVPDEDMSVDDDPAAQDGISSRDSVFLQPTTTTSPATSSSPPLLPGAPQNIIMKSGQPFLRIAHITLLKNLGPILENGLLPGGGGKGEGIHSRLSDRMETSAGPFGGSHGANIKANNAKSGVFFGLPNSNDDIGECVLANLLQTAAGFQLMVEFDDTPPTWSVKTQLPVTLILDIPFPADAEVTGHDGPLSNGKWFVDPLMRGPGPEAPMQTAFSYSGVVPASFVSEVWLPKLQIVDQTESHYWPRLVKSKGITSEDFYKFDPRVDNFHVVEFNGATPEELLEKAFAKLPKNGSFVLPIETSHKWMGLPW